MGSYTMLALFIKFGIVPSAWCRGLMALVIIAIRAGGDLNKGAGGTLGKDEPNGRDCRHEWEDSACSSTAAAKVPLGEPGGCRRLC